MFSLCIIVLTYFLYHSFDNFLNIKCPDEKVLRTMIRKPWWQRPTPVHGETDPRIAGIHHILWLRGGTLFIDVIISLYYCWTPPKHAILTCLKRVTSQLYERPFASRHSSSLVHLAGGVLHYACLLMWNWLIKLLLVQMFGKYAFNRTYINYIKMLYK